MQGIVHRQLEALHELDLLDAPRELEYVGRRLTTTCELEYGGGVHALHTAAAKITCKVRSIPMEDKFREEVLQGAVRPIAEKL